MKKIFDFNVHLPYVLKNDLNQSVYNETDIEADQIFESYRKYSKILKETICGANFMFLNEKILLQKELDNIIKTIKNDFERCYFTFIVDFRKDKYEYLIDRAIECGAHGVKFHSYIQKISLDDFADVLKVSKYAENHGLFICIDTSYGTSGIYRYDNLRLAAFLSEFISDVPIILLHSAGIRILEAMLLADCKKNIYLETSFSLPYLLGSSVEQDFAFSYKKIGTDKILYGSDFPYVSIEDSVNVMNNFFEKYNFNYDDIERIMFNNALRLPNVS